ncbi:MAG: hypothetical protein AAGD47_03985, partial [Pseudomonadota bacterium]
AGARDPRRAGGRGGRPRGLTGIFAWLGGGSDLPENQVFRGLARLSGAAKGAFKSFNVGIWSAI